MKFLFFTILLLTAMIFTVDAVSAQKTTTKNGASSTTLPRANADADGDGVTDWVVVRGAAATSSVDNAANSFNKSAIPKSYRERAKLRRLQQQSQTAPAPARSAPLNWFTNSNKAGGAFSSAQFGSLETDFAVPEDFDGDGRDDIAVWRTGATADGSAGFFILQSQSGTVAFEQFGADGDDPTVTGDYDGDGKADPAVFRCPNAAAGQCYFFYRASSNNPNRAFSSVPFGYGTALEDITAAPGDYDGDGKYDFCIYRNIGGNVGQFVLSKSTDGAVEYINWGLFSDTIVPGDFDGDRKADFMLTRNQNGSLAWYLLTRTGGGTGASPHIWGLADSDFEVPGDYDGDGKTDIAVWRADADPDMNYYFVRRSTNGKMLSFEWGQYGDFPVQNWYVH